MSRYLAGLNPEQKKAVCHVKGPLLVLAGAGSGKTRVVVNRIGYLLEKKACAPKNILAITFTNKAAGEMRERLKKMIGARADDMSVCTSHSLGNRILREFHEEAGVPRNFKILSEQEKLIFLKSKLREVTARNESVDLWWIASRISLAKNSGLTSETYPDNAEKAALVRRSFAVYEKTLNRMAALDFDDLLLKPLALLKSGDTVLKKLRERFAFISLDEYQDTNRIQFETVKLLAAPKNNICAVGDDDQGIYSWRGADIGNILSFSTVFPGTVKIKLERNYRSTTTILSAANAVISKNAHRTEKAMWSDKTGGDPIEHYQAEDEQDEAEWLAKTVSELQKAGIADYRDMAVLCRTNEMARIYEVEFQRCKIPYKIPGGGGFYERKEVKDLHAYLQFIANPLDELSLARIIRMAPWHVNKESMKALEAEAGGKKCPLWEVLKTTDQDGASRFAALIKKYMGLYRKGSLPSAFKDMVVDVKYRDHLNALYAERKDEAAKRLAVVNELEHSIALFARKRKKADLYAYLQEVEMMMNDKEEADDHRDCAVLMTFHSSKGMEFPVVFLPGLDDEVMPSKKSVQEGKLDEERRLFYVGLTRAQKRLYLSWPSTRFLYNKHRPVTFCRFISDIPENLLAAPIGKREAENREVLLGNFFKEMQEKLKAANLTGTAG